MLLVLTVEVQVRIVEEPYLATAHGDAYHDYLSGVGRFVPGVGSGQPLTSLSRNAGSRPVP